MLFFSKRKELDNLYQEWRKENYAKDVSFNVISYLEAMGLLNEDKVRELLGKE